MFTAIIITYDVREQRCNVKFFMKLEETSTETTLTQIFNHCLAKDLHTKKSRSNIKVVGGLTIFFSTYNGVVHFALLFQGQTVNHEAFYNSYAK